MDYMFGRRIKWGFSIDESGNFYLPKGFRTDPDAVPSTRREVREMIQAAVVRASQENPSFYHNGINNRMPPDVEKSVNPAIVRLHQMRKAETGCAGVKPNSNPSLPEID